MSPFTIKKTAVKIGVGVPATLVLAPVVPWLVLVLRNPLTDWVAWIMPGVWADAYQEERVSFGIVDRMLSLAEWVAAGSVLAALVVAIGAAVSFVIWGAFHLLAESAKGSASRQPVTPDAQMETRPGGVEMKQSRFTLILALAALITVLTACTREVVKEVQVEAEAQVVKEVPVEVMTVVAERGRSEGFNVIGGTATVNDEPYDLTFFQHYGVNPFIDTEDDHLSTFAMDVDTASYTVTRRFLQDGNLPDPDSVRVEEFVNFFEQGYDPPTEAAFAINVEGSPSPFGGANHWLMRVGLQGKTVDPEQRKDATLIFTIDVSGSMAREDRLGMVKRALQMLVDELRPADEVGIVVYGNSGRVVLEPTSGSNKDTIMSAVRSLNAGGSTYVEDGLRLAYQMAAERARQEHPGRIVRVLLLSDGVGNVGRTGAGSILRQIRDNVDEGVSLTTVGFGMGNYNDVLMEQLANDGDGSYHYVDSLSEARRIFSENLVGTLQLIAKDAKVQVDFNPATVSRYRLLGYENRRVADEDFRNDAVDAGEVGAGHSVTALYELKLRDDASGTLATVALRYEDPDTGEVSELSREFQRRELVAGFEEASPRFQMAAVVAEYAELLRGSYWAQDGSLEAVVPEAMRVRDLLREDISVAEFADMVARTEEVRATMSQ